MNLLKTTEVHAPEAHQQTLDFTGSEFWDQLPPASREACRQALSRLLSQVIMQQEQQPEANDISHEREDSI